MRKILLVAVAFLTSWRLCSGQTVPDTPKGFDKQYQKAWNEARRGKPDKADALVKEFALPDAWFADTFGPGAGAALQQQYKVEFAEFRAQTLNDIVTQLLVKKGDLSPGDARNLSITTKRVEGTGAVAKGKPAPEPHKPLPAIEYFQTEVYRPVEEDLPTKFARWANLYVYVDGNFRFFGRGEYPFWDPLNIRLADPCAKPGDVPGGKLMKRVEPQYPADALRAGAEGRVNMLVKVGRDGKVEDVDLEMGEQSPGMGAKDASLLAAAKAAVMQWEYTPFINCGKPVEMRTMEAITFQLSDKSVH